MSGASSSPAQNGKGKQSWPMGKSREFTQWTRKLSLEDKSRLLNDALSMAWNDEAERSRALEVQCDILVKEYQRVLPAAMKTYCATTVVERRYPPKYRDPILVYVAYDESFSFVVQEGTGSCKADAETKPTSR